MLARVHLLRMDRRTKDNHANSSIISLVRLAKNTRLHFGTMKKYQSLRMSRIEPALTAYIIALNYTLHSMNGSISWLDGYNHQSNQFEHSSITWRMTRSNQSHILTHLTS